jgi:hypothetical protein
MRRSNRLQKERDLRDLSRAFTLWVDEDYAFVIVGDLKLPPGYNDSTTNVLVELPGDYPLSPPGVGDHGVFLSPHLRFGGRKLKDLHTYRTPEVRTPGFGPWAWFCYQYVRWSPQRDDLIKFIEMVRADLTDPRTYRR